MEYLKHIKTVRKSGAYFVGLVHVSRAYEDEVCIILECGYRQRFWTTQNTDAELIERTRKMKEVGISTASFQL